jgi:hypothetical protein
METEMWDELLGASNRNETPATGGVMDWDASVIPPRG